MFQDLPIIAAVTDTCIVVWTPVLDGTWVRSVFGEAFSHTVEARLREMFKLARMGARGALV